MDVRPGYGETTNKERPGARLVDKTALRRQVALLLLVVTPAGFLFKFYAGPGAWWFNDLGVGVLYEIFWILVAFFIRPTRTAIRLIPWWVFAITSVLEVLQLWHPWFLQRLRATFLGATLLGTTFDWRDFPHYAAGCWLGWLGIRYLYRRQVKLGSGNTN